MIVDGATLKETLSGLRLAIFFFNKDARSLLRARAAGLGAFPFTVEWLVDPTLAFRPRVRALAEAVVDPGRIVTDGAALERLLAANAFDAAVVFEDGYEDQLQEHLLAYDEPDISSFDELVAKCRADQENHRRIDPNAEFNARWSKACVQFLAEHLSQRGVLVVNAYNAVIQSVRAQDENVLAFTQRHAILPTIPPDLADVPVRFVIGEDWACGKTSYLVDRMREGASGIAGDFWFRLVSPEAIPMFHMQDIFGIKGVIANLIRKAHDRNPGKPVYVKYDGRLEEFVFGIPRDRTYLVKDMHHFFRDCRFVVVHKQDSARMRELVGRFARKYEVDPARIDRVRMHHDGRAEDLGPLPAA